MAVCVFSTVNQIEAGLLKGALDEQNIDNYVQNYHLNNMGVGVGGLFQSLSGSPLAAGLDIKVIVKDEDAEKALEVVKVLFGDSEEDSGSIEIEETSAYSNVEENIEENKNLPGDQKSSANDGNIEGTIRPSRIDKKEKTHTKDIKFLIFITILICAFILLCR
jgi:hypothetical protein